MTQDMSRYKKNTPVRIRYACGKERNCLFVYLTFKIRNNLCVVYFVTFM